MAVKQDQDGRDVRQQILAAIEGVGLKPIFT
jgi:hypothetical protein